MNICNIRVIFCVKRPKVPSNLEIYTRENKSAKQLNETSELQNNNTSPPCMLLIYAFFFIKDDFAPKQLPSLYTFKMAN